jgi:hypothetical protein
MENRPTNNNNIIGAVGSFNLDDSQGYYVIQKQKVAEAGTNLN